MDLEVFAFHLSGPANACEAARVVVASESVAAAARLVRLAGWHGVRHQAAFPSRDDDEQRQAMTEPGVVWWYPWSQIPPRNWHRAVASKASK